MDSAEYTTGKPSDPLAAAEYESEEQKAFHDALASELGQGYAVGRLLFDENGTAHDYQLVKANAAYLDLVGLSPEAPLHRPVGEVAGYLEPARLETLAEVVKTGQPQAWEFYSQRTGKHYRVHTYRPCPGCFASIFTDMTGNRQAERTMVVSGDFARQILMSSLNGIYIFNFDTGRNEFINHLYEDITGYSLEDIHEMSQGQFGELFHPDDQPRIEAHWQKMAAAADEDVFEIEYRFKTKSGRWIWCLSRDTVSTRHADGSVREIIGAFLDITDKKNAEQKLQKSEKLYRSIAENLPNVAVFLIDRDLRFVMAAGEALLLAQFESLDLEGKSIYEVLAPSVAAEYEPYYRQALAGRPFQIEHDCRGRRFTSRGIPFFNTEGELYAALVVSYDITEGIRIEDALRQSRLDLERAQSVGQIGSWRMDVGRNILTWSNENYRIFGIPNGTPLTYETFLSTVHPDDRDYVDRKWQAALRGEPYDIEHRLLVGETVKWVREKAYLELDQEDHLRGGFGITQDITQHKQVEQALQESEWKYRELVQRASSAIVRLDRYGTILFFNEYAQDFFGYTPEEVLGRNINIIVPEHASNGRDMSSLVRDIVDHPERYRNNVNENVLRDGRRVWMTWTNVAIRDESGEVKEILAIGSDITELRRTQQELKSAYTETEKERARLMAALDSAPMGAIFYNTDHEITFLNQAAERLLGFTLAEIQHLPAEKRNWLFGVRKTDHTRPPQDALASWRALQGETVLNEESLTLPHKGEKYRHILSHAAPIRQADGCIIGAVQSIIDITELIETREAAEKANRVRSQFLANMSHELRTPLAGIVGMAELLANRLRSSPELPFVEMLKNASQSLTDLINEVLDFSKIEAVGLKIYASPFNIAEEIQKLVGLFSVPAEQKGNRLDWKIDPNIPQTLCGDYGRLNQVLRNLVSNAVKFTQNGLIDLRVSQTRLYQNRAVIRFEVSDTGPGISKTEQARIFDDFYQVEGHLTKEHNGTGLGLAIVRKIVTAMNGRIWVESEDGQGSLFVFEVPLDIVGDENASDQTSTGGVIDLNGCRVLLAEDNQINRIYMEEILQEAGCVVRTAQNGREAIEILNREDFQIVLMDIQMPQMDGYAAIREIRSLNAPPKDIPIIALTAYTSPADIQRVISAGADNHVGKPVNLDKLITVIKQLVYPQTDQGLESPSTDLLDLMLKKPAFYTLLCEKAMKNLIQQERVIKEALQQRLYINAAQAFHSLAGMVAIFGLEPLRQKYLELENKAQHCRNKEASIETAEFQPLIDQQMRHLAAIKSRLKKHQ